MFVLLSWFGLSPLPTKSLFAVRLFLFNFFCCAEETRPTGTHYTIRMAPHVKYLQFVESITQYGVHLRRP